MTDPVGQFAPGIYFGLAAEPYHADKAIGGTDANLLVRDPVEFQYRRLNPPEVETPALIRGQAQHARCLEGMHAFDRAFKIKPEKDDYADPILDTMDELRDYAYGLGLDKLPRLKDDLIALIRQKAPKVNIFTIWAEVMEIYERDQRTGIGWDVTEQIEQTAAWMQADPLLSEVMEEGSFTGGAPEVSLFWEEGENSVRCKARLDYLYRHAIVDLKTFSPWRDQSVEAGAIAAIVAYRYDIQAAHYLRGWHAARELFLREGEKVVFTFDGVDRKEMLSLCEEGFSLTGDPNWIWVFLKAIGAPQPIVLEWRREQSPLAFENAEREVVDALDRYRKLRTEFGNDKAWPPRHAAVKLDDGMWPPWFGRR